MLRSLRTLGNQVIVCRGSSFPSLGKDSKKVFPGKAQHKEQKVVFIQGMASLRSRSYGGTGMANDYHSG